MKTDEPVAGVERVTNALLDLNQAADMHAIDKIFQGTSNYGEDNIRGFADALQRLTDPGLNQKLNRLAQTISLGAVDSGEGALTDQLNKVGQALANLVESGHADEAAQLFHKLSLQADTVGVSSEKLMTLLPDYGEALAGVSNEQELASGSAGQLAGGVKKVGGEAEHTTSLIDDLDNALKAFYATTFSVKEASDAYYSSLNDLSDAIKDNGKRLKGNSDAAISNRGALRDVASAADDVISKMVAQGASYEQVVAKTRTLKKAYDEHAAKAHITGAAVKEVDDYLNALPGTYEAVLAARDNVSPVVAKAKARLQNLDGFQAHVDLLYRIHTTGDNPFNLSPGPGVGILAPAKKTPLRTPRQAHRDGGMVEGVGGPREDNQLIWASPKEFVINAASTAKHLPLIEAINADRYADGGLVDRYAAAHFTSVPRFADGGGVRSAAPVMAGPSRHTEYHIDTHAPTAREVLLEAKAMQDLEDAAHPNY
jgi:methyl-accepting chemotaxis protein